MDKEIAAPTGPALMNGVSMLGDSQQQQQLSESPLPSSEQTQWDFSTPISLDDGLSDESDFDLYYYNDYLTEDAVKGAQARQRSPPPLPLLHDGISMLAHGQQVRIITEQKRTTHHTRPQCVFLLVSLAGIAER